jgi:MOSC domain-containing protein YiiM
MVLPAGASVVSTPQDIVEVTPEGFAGDRHAGRTRPAGVRDARGLKGRTVRNDRQVSIVAVEELRQIAKALDVPEIQPTWLGANLALSGLPDLSRRPAGTRLVFPDGTELEIEATNNPCTAPGKIIASHHDDHPGMASAFPKAAKGLRGVVASVRRSGTIRTGDPVRVFLP